MFWVITSEGIYAAIDYYFIGQTETTASQIKVYQLVDPVYIPFLYGKWGGQSSCKDLPNRGTSAEDNVGQYSVSVCLTDVVKLISEQIMFWGISSQKTEWRNWIWIQWDHLAVSLFSSKVDQASLFSQDVGTPDTACGVVERMSHIGRFDLIMFCCLN